MEDKLNYYTQREWDRTVGIGKVPPEYQHPDDKNDAYIPKLVVWFGFVLSGATVLLLPLDVANNEGYAGKLLNWY